MHQWCKNFDVRTADSGLAIVVISYTKPSHEILDALFKVVSVWNISVGMKRRQNQVVHCVSRAFAVSYFGSLITVDP